MKKKVLLFIISAILFIISLPPFKLHLSWIALVPFFIVLWDSERKCLDGACFGVLLGSMIFGFIFSFYGQRLQTQMFLYFILNFYCGVIFGIYGFFINRIHEQYDNYFIRISLSAMAWSIIEYVSNRFLGISMSYMYYDNYLLLVVSRFIGISGVSLLIVFINLYITRLVIGFIKSEPLSKLLKRTAIPIICLVIVSCFSGFPQPKTGNHVREISLALIQGNISSYEYESAQKVNSISKKILKKYIELTEESVAKYHPDLVVWPETVVHRWMFRIPEYRNMIYKLCKINKIYLITGCPDLDENNEEFNSAFLISPAGQVIKRYDKKVLVPFIEKGFKAGKEEGIIPVKGINFGVQICYESFFSHISASLVNNGADALIVLSNNGMFGSSIIPFISSISSVFRAAENGVHTFQVMNTGFTQVILPNGKIEKNGVLFKEDIQFFQLKMSETRKTIYSKYGGVLYSIIIIFFILSCFDVLRWLNKFKTNLRRE